MSRAGIDVEIQNLWQGGGGQGGQGAATGVLDATLEYIRLRGLTLLPLYVAGMLPFSIVTLLLIDVISAEHRSAAWTWCLLLVPSTLWRWGWLAKMQEIVHREAQARGGAGDFWRRLPAILLTRLYANIAITWGSLLIAPGFYGVFVGSFAAPVLLDRPGRALREVWRMLGWVHHAGARLAKVLWVMLVFTGLVIVASLAVQYAVVGLVMPSLMGVDATGAWLTLWSIPWLLGLFYFLFLALDFGWTIASVFLYYDSQSRRTGSDLRTRMQALRVQAGTTEQGRVMERDAA